MEKQQQARETLIVALQMSAVVQHVGNPGSKSPNEAEVWPFNSLAVADKGGPADLGAVIC